jgi:predicted enzyme related to lactoylglutathione lyase
MITGGNATVFVSNMDAAVQFYTQVEAGKGLTIGLHPASPKYPAPGTKGAMMLGLEIDEAIDNVVARLGEKGVRMKGAIIQGVAGNFVHLEDPDGNEIYLWEVDRKCVPEADLENELVEAGARS